MSECRDWDRPVLLDRKLRLGSDRATAIELSGSYNAWQVWINAPQTWLDVAVTFELVSMGETAFADAKLVRDIERGSFPEGGGVLVTDPGVVSGLLWEAQGFAADTLRVIVRPTSPAPVLGEALFYARAWGCGAEGGSRMGRPQVDLWASRHQQVSTSQVIGAAVTTLFAAQPDGNRIYVTRLSHNVIGAPAGICTLQTRNPTTAVVTPRARWIVGSAGEVDQHVEEFTYPLRPQRGDSWELVSVPGGAFETCDLTGFVE